MQRFNLWCPRALDGTISFDVTPADGGYLACGTAELIDAFLAALGVPATTAGFEIAPIASPYFSSYPDAGEPADWCPLGWTVRVEPNPSSPAIPPPWGMYPVPSGEKDPTWRPPDDEYWRWDTRPVVAIGDCRRERYAEVLTALRQLEAPDGQLSVVAFPLNDHLAQVRMELGTLHADRETVRIREALQQLRAAGVDSTCWSHSILAGLGL